MVRSSQSSKRPPEPVVHIIDDDASLRESLVDFFAALDMPAVAFANTASFLAAATPEAGCILLDIRLPGLNGLELQAHLNERGRKMPIIFMTGFGDIPMTVQAMKAGASDFLTKPFSDKDLLEAVRVAFARDAELRAAVAQSEAHHERYRHLTPREQEVMRLVVQGLMNKQIAYELGISEVTVKLHRGNVMRKMDVRSLADLVRIAEGLALGK
ncbi:response regulator transcription factor [Martelella alba]|uniref:Response regulator transcription factor n=1 Tax=Martelella alba TaxID=2590451 RepID=A0A506TY19_9HYPH|nr:response regulator transcription factor [Martelella alba]TPW26962.1 response regulator transcription factor [Martelella alba]